MAADDQENLTGETISEGAAEATTAVEEKLDLDVTIDKRGSCERHVKVTIPRKDIDRYFHKAFSELMKSAQVPGFRQGRVPRKLIESKFRKDVTDQIKGSLLVDSLSQLSDTQQLAAIGEPDFDMATIEIPKTGDMTFEFNIEVRPDFDLPQWKGLSIERPTREVVDADIDERLGTLLDRVAERTDVTEGAQPGDVLVLDAHGYDGDKTISHGHGLEVRLEPKLHLEDGDVENFGELMAGVKVGDVRSTMMKIADEAPNETYRGKEVKVEFKVTAVKRLSRPELTPEVLEQHFGDFDSVEGLRKAVSNVLVQQLGYEQQQRARKQILEQLTSATQFDLPQDLLKRQAQRELERSVLELRSYGFTDDMIMQHAARLRQNTISSTSKSLREHFVLEKIAEEEKLDASADDYENEIQRIAYQRGASTRQVRADLENRNQMDALRNQIIERKVIEVILANAQVQEVPFEFPKTTAASASWLASGEPGAEPHEHHHDHEHGHDHDHGHEHGHEHAH